MQPSSLTGISGAAVQLRDGRSWSLPRPGHAVPRARPAALGAFAFLHDPQNAASAGPVSCRTRKSRPILQGGETDMPYLVAVENSFWQLFAFLQATCGTL